MKIVREALRFGIVGVSATAIHYILYIVTLAWLSESPAYSVGYFISFLFNYYMSARFTFKKKSNVRNGAGFIGAHAFNYLLQVTLLNFFISIGISREVAPVPVYCIAVPVNFMVVRFVFRKS